MPQSPYMYPAGGINGGGMNGIAMASGMNNFFGMPTGREILGAQQRLQALMMQCEHLQQVIQLFVQEYDAFAQNVMASAQQYTAQIETRIRNVSAELNRVMEEYQNLQEMVINELRKWQRNQALAGNGAPTDDNLGDIQACIEMLVETVTKIIHFANFMRMKLPDHQEYPSMLSQLRHAQEVLVLSAFIVERQPPQVMKTHTRFAAAVRWLIGPQLGIHLNNPTVECIILSEAQAQRHSTPRTRAEGAPASSGEIMNNSTSMDYQPQTHLFSASFRNMQLKKIKRAEKKGTESVMDEKFALLFYTSAVVNSHNPDNSYRIHAWTLSLPVVVIVHGNQEPQSWATITWDNAFSDISREPFQVPERVLWSQLSSALNMKFASTTGRALTEENLNFLYEKLFRNDYTGGDHKDHITWTQFCKETLPDRSFTFWDWFFAIMKLTKDHLLGLWKAGLIVGFINKHKTTEEILPSRVPGTFLLRFSDSELGGITVGVIDDQGKTFMLSPWTARDLSVRCLADRVHDLQMLRYIYPSGQLKEEAFQEFCTQRVEVQGHDGYVPNTIRAHVPAYDNQTPRSVQSPPLVADVPMSNTFPPDFDMQYDWITGLI